LLLDEVVEKSIPARVAEFVPATPTKEDPANYGALLNWVNTSFPLGLSAKEAAFETKTYEENCEYIIERIKRAYDLKTTGVLPQLLEESERLILLEAIDELWQEHLYAIDGLREGVRLRSYGQKDPLVEYKSEAYVMFNELMNNINSKALGNLFKSHDRLNAWMDHIRQSMLQARHTSDEQPVRAIQGSGDSGDSSEQVEDNSPKITIPLKREVPKVGRNDLCPCGSGKKFKSCHGRAS
jgi:preprotein translocase subunit SecA